MKAMRLNAIAALMAAAALAACGGGGGGDPDAGAPAPAPAPGPGAPPPPAGPTASAPVHTLSSTSANVTSSGTLVFGVDNGNLITIDDPDGGLLTTVLSVSAGRLTVDSDSGATITGDGTEEVTIVGTIADINAALDGMVYTAPNGTGTISLVIATRDDSAPAPLSARDEFTINVEALPVPQFRSFQLASDVLGQANFTSSSSGPPNERNLLAPRGAVAFGPAPFADRIYVPDAGHNRVLVFPPGSGAGDSAEFVLGQPGFFSGGGNVAQGTHPQAAHVAISGDRMAVAEPSANRVSLYLSLPRATSDVTDALLGQESFTTFDSGCALARLNSPRSVSIAPDGETLVVADTGNHRVNIYNAFPPSGATDPLADVVLGQPTGNQCLANRGGTPHSRSMNQPTGVWTDGTQIVVADTGNNRVLIWSAIPTPGAPDHERGADFVLGQENFGAVLPNRGAPTPSRYTLNAPTHVASDGTRLAVADTGNHRVLIWNTFPAASNVPADKVLGQVNFLKNLPNDADQTGGSDGPSARVFSSPTGLTFEQGKLYVTDRDNNRVLVFEPQ